VKLFDHPELIENYKFCENMKDFEQLIVSNIENYTNEHSALSYESELQYPPPEVDIMNKSKKHSLKHHKYEPPKYVSPTFEELITDSHVIIKEKEAPKYDDVPWSLDGYQG